MDASPLAKLPGELRNEIYKLILYEPNGIHLRWDKEKSYVRRCEPYPSSYAMKVARRYGHALALEQACRELRTECYSLFFALNTFYMRVLAWHNGGNWSQSQRTDSESRIAPYQDWLKQIGQHNAAVIPRTVIDGQFLDTHGCRYNRATDGSGWDAAREMENQLLKPIAVSATIDINIMSLLELPHSYLLHPGTV